MEQFLEVHQRKLKTLIRQVDTYERSLRSLSDWWGKIALIGKINSLDVAATILEDMDTAKQRFNELQGRLIASLVREHVRKAILHDQTRCQMAIDVLIRNLFERTADIGFLALDDDVGAFLASEEVTQDDALAIRHRLHAYVAKYSVYDDVVLLTPDGQVKARLDTAQQAQVTASPMLRRALKGDEDFVEAFGPMDLFNDSNDHLIYAHRVEYQGRVVGVICLCFRFQNEMQGIFSKLVSAQDSRLLVLLNDAHQVIASSDSRRIPLATRLTSSRRPVFFNWQGKEYLMTSATGQPYQGYAGPQGWRAVMLMPLDLFNGELVRQVGAGKSDQSVINKSDMDSHPLFAGELGDIRRTSTLINNELELIVLNGIITAARKESAEFMPVLEAIKRIGRDIDTVFSESIDSLYSTAMEGQLDEVRLQAALAVDILDRNLYERANDCRWWALNPVLREHMALLQKHSAEGNPALMSRVLNQINALYTVYTTLYLYDDNHRLVAFSGDTHGHLLGTRAEDHSGADQALQLKDHQDYSVSAFQPFACYENRATYVYNAAVRHPENDARIVGGIGIVFDSEPQFRAILQDVLPRSEEGEIVQGCFSVFTTREGVVLSCSDERYAPGHHLAVPAHLAKLPCGEVASQWLELDNEGYLLGMAASGGYREYKTSDGYENDILAWVLVPA
ncbi:cache domain-containing protein [Pokkaliibacter sp. CJK22405]|uniref:cache domain-containing protein n=1 Tax=Pokkaliibacter sp. CJK22405 TaxID=3384615 RepID=UPI003984C9A3